MTTTTRNITCPLCFEKVELRRANEWTRTPRYLRQLNRPAFLRYNSKGRTDTYFNDGHDCSKQYDKEINEWSSANEKE